MQVPHVRDLRLLVVGFSGHYRVSDEVFTREPIANYLNELTTRRSSVTWLSYQSPAGEYVYRTSISSRIRTIALDGSRRTAAGTVAQLFREEPFDMIAAYPAVMLLLPFLFFVPKRSGRWLLYVGNDLWRRPTYQETFRDCLKRRLRSVAMNLLLRRFDHVLARGKYLTREIAKRGTPTTETLPLISIKCEKKNYKESERGRYFLFVGKLEPEKGVEELLAAYVCHRQRTSAGVPLLLAGQGPLFARLRETSVRDPLIQALGYVDDADHLSELVFNAKAVFLPTRAPEGIPRIIDEAKSLGTPIWATPTQAVLEQFGNSICYFDCDPPTTKSIEAALEEAEKASHYPPQQMRGAREAAQQHLRLVNA